MDETLQLTLAFVIPIVIIALLILFLILNKFVFSRIKMRKTHHEIEKKYEYLHALLIGQDSQYVSRLEMISRTNLIYSEIHSTYFKKFKDIRDNVDSKYYDILTQLSLLSEQNKTKEFFSLLKNESETLKDYEAQINKFNDDLITLFKPEEETRHMALNLKEKLRNIKSRYNSNEVKLELCAPSFNAVFKEMESRFNSFEGYIESANYDEAKEILPSISKVLDYLDSIIEKLPGYIYIVNDELPQSIASLKDHYNEEKKNGYPLSNLNFKKVTEEIDKSLKTLVNEIKNLNLRNCDEKIDKIKNVINEINRLLDYEVECKKYYDENYSNVLTEFTNLEKSFVKISNDLVNIQKYYVLDEDELAKLEILKVEMNKVSKNKIRLEMYVHNKESSPFSVLKEKIIDLHNGVCETKNKYDEFITYLKSLKSDSEFIFEDNKKIYFSLKKYEKRVLLLNDKNYEDLANKDFEYCYALLDEINEITKNIPIDVKRMKQLHTDINNKIDSLFRVIDTNLDYKKKCEKNIILLNRDRVKFADINTMMKDIENLYFKGNYSDAYNMSVNVLDKLKDKAGLTN